MDKKIKIMNKLSSQKQSMDKFQSRKQLKINLSIRPKIHLSSQPLTENQVLNKIPILNGKRRLSKIQDKEALCQTSKKSFKFVLPRKKSSLDSFEIHKNLPKKIEKLDENEVKDIQYKKRKVIMSEGNPGELLRGYEIGSQVKKVSTDNKYKGKKLHKISKTSYSKKRLSLENISWDLRKKFKGLDISKPQTQNSNLTNIKNLSITNYFESRVEENSVTAASSENNAQVEQNDTLKTEAQQKEETFELFNNLIREGHYIHGDKPLRIIKAEYDENISDVIFTIEWKMNEKTFRPTTSNITREELLKYDPLLLLYFYEKHLEFSMYPDFTNNELDRIPRTVFQPSLDL